MRATGSPPRRAVRLRRRRRRPMIHRAMIHLRETTTSYTTLMVRLDRHRRRSLGVHLLHQRVHGDASLHLVHARRADAAIDRIAIQREPIPSARQVNGHEERKISDDDLPQARDRHLAPDRELRDDGWQFQQPKRVALLDSLSFVDHRLRVRHRKQHHERGDENVELARHEHAQRVQGPSNLSQKRPRHVFARVQRQRQRQRQRRARDDHPSHDRRLLDRDRHAHRPSRRPRRARLHLCRRGRRRRARRPRDVLRARLPPRRLPRASRRHRRRRRRAPRVASRRRDGRRRPRRRRVGAARRRRARAPRVFDAREAPSSDATVRRRPSARSTVRDPSKTRVGFTRRDRARFRRRAALRAAASMATMALAPARTALRREFANKNSTTRETKRTTRAGARARAPKRGVANAARAMGGESEVFRAWDQATKSQKRTDLKKIMILGAGPIVIGQVRARDDAIADANGTGGAGWEGVIASASAGAFLNI